MNLDKAIKERHSARKFKTRKPDWRKILKALESATKAPTAGNIPTVKFILVENKEKIEELAQAATQSFITTAHYVIVVCSDPKLCRRSYGERAEKYFRQQAGAAIQTLFLKLTDLGLSTCWVGAFSDTTVRRILRIPDDIEIEAIMPIGYEMIKTKQRAKPRLDTCLFFHKWKNKYMREIKAPEAR